MISETQVRARLDSLAKPRQSLGKLEDLAVRLACAQQSLEPVTQPRRLVVFAADHGVVASGVSAWGAEVTALMVSTIVSGRSASAALAAAHRCELRVVDVGVAAPLDGLAAPHFRRAGVAPGTQDLSRASAMTLAQFDAAWEVGAGEARAAIASGNRVLIAGEMGIGNTTSAACLTSLLADVPADRATGRGAGADDTTLDVKRNVVTRAVARAREIMPRNPREAIASVAGFEIIAMAGFFAEGARQPVMLMVDGYVATAAALVAEALQPGTARQMIAAHLSAEPGHRAALDKLALEPMLEWNMRLGEGTGALVALPLLDSARALLCDVASLQDLGVARED